MAGQMDKPLQRNRNGCQLSGTPRTTATRGCRIVEAAVTSLLLEPIEREDRGDGVEEDDGAMASAKEGGGDRGGCLRDRGPRIVVEEVALDEVIGAVADRAVVDGRDDIKSEGGRSWPSSAP